MLKLAIRESLFSRNTKYLAVGRSAKLSGREKVRPYSTNICYEHFKTGRVRPNVGLRNEFQQVGDKKKIYTSFQYRNLNIDKKETKLFESWSFEKITVFWVVKSQYED